MQYRKIEKIEARKKGEKNMTHKEKKEGKKIKKDD